MNNETHISSFLINDLNETPSKKHNGSINTQNQDKKFLTFFVSIYKNENEGSKKYRIKAKF